MRKRWGSRRKPLPDPPDVQPRHRGPHTWHWWDLLPIPILGWPALVTLNWGHWIFSAWCIAILILLTWGIAMPKDGSLGELARRLAATTIGRVVAWLLFLGIVSGIAYWVYLAVTFE